MAKRTIAADRIEPAFDDSCAEQDWNQHSQIIVLRNFIESEAENDPLVAERFQTFLDNRIEEENQRGEEQTE